jgi:hypothetical protein
MAATKAATLKSGGINILRFGLAALPLYPAIKINLDAAQGQGETWVAVGIAFVIFGALCIEHSLHALRGRQAVTALLWSVLGVGFLALNGMNAIANLASHTDHSRDENRAKMQTAADISTQRTELTERRRAQAALAGGEASPESLEAEIKAAKASNSKLWQASFSCDPAWITRDETRKFCGKLGDLEAKKAAATKRDQIDAQLAKLTEKAEVKGEAPSTVDSFADAMADGLSAFGYEVNDKTKLAIVRVRDWSKAIGVEVLAAFGPAALLGLFFRGVAPLPDTRPVRRPLSTNRAYFAAPFVDKSQKRRIAFSWLTKKAEEKEPELDPALPSDPMDRFILTCLEASDREDTPQKQIWSMWDQEAERLGVDKRSAKALSAKLRAHGFGYDRNKGRPLYIGVRIRQPQIVTQPQKTVRPVRLAVVNSAAFG